MYKYSQGKTADRWSEENDNKIFTIFSSKLLSNSKSSTMTKGHSPPTKRHLLECNWFSGEVFNSDLTFISSDLYDVRIFDSVDRVSHALNKSKYKNIASNSTINLTDAINKSINGPNRPESCPPILSSFLRQSMEGENQLPNSSHFSPLQNLVSL